jgi:hypothetical protein
MDYEKLWKELKETLITTKDIVENTCGEQARQTIEAYEYIIETMNRRDNT